MKKILIFLAFISLTIILSSCAPQSSQTNTNVPKEINTNVPKQKTELNVNKADLDKLKADINKMEFENINGLSQ
jgi:PBP1b-binding outer membrane lipoprotein LpoB